MNFQIQTKILRTEIENLIIKYQFSDLKYEISNSNNNFENWNNSFQIQLKIYQNWNINFKI
jgi:hypothetical protein